MTFLAPIGLLALLALPVIVFLHLLQARRRRAVVPSLLIWWQIPSRPAARRRRRLRWTLLLLLHLLAALLIGLALAQPQIPLPWLGAARATAI
ncbi:BatA domain-containing protein, partial [Chloroflexus sp.]|uniref:BatA domain-containing protein n=1 Tax=Chloroflexus sp. TaxID=1904827 RepID=UPI002ACEF86A